MLGVRFIAVACLALCACFFDRAEHAQACESDRECASDTRCYEGFCVARDAAVAGCARNGAIESCYDGQPAETAGIGTCQAGQRICVDGVYSECLGQVLPDDEVCNGRDDDCDGEVDNVTGSSTCDSHLRGACSEGTLMCRDGVEFCQPTHESQTEACNAIDDDCDGATDEISTGMCYPEGAPGCMLDAQGVWRCYGLCTTGQSGCDGTTEACAGAIVPIDELCTDGAAVAQDEDCDGAIDESCTCMNGQQRGCYAGPTGTEDLGICGPGMQTCTGDGWGDCTGQVLPRAETCDNPNADDDCNGVEDDVAGLDLPCIALGERGECRNGTIACAAGALPACVPSEASKELCDELDQDCDGDPTNTFDFNSDETCGACDVQCSADETCCGGGCIELASLETDEGNCGGCGNSCGVGRYCCQGECLSAEGPMAGVCACKSDCGDRACCGDACRDLETDKANCGACGRKCGPGKECRAGACK